MNDPLIECSSNPSDADVADVVAGLEAANNEVGPPGRWERLFLLIRDDHGGLAGGLVGHTHWGWLFVQYLRVHPACRHRGYGRALPAEAERVAKKRGCDNAYLDTFDFQALSFYEGPGYKVYGALRDFPAGHTRYFLGKRGLGGES